MELDLNNTTIWFIVGFVLFLLEFALPGFILFFFAVGAWIVAIITLLLDVSINIQLSIFIGTSLLSVLLFRNWLKNQIGKRKTENSELEDEFIGKTAVAQSAIAPGQSGKVAFKGTIWDAESNDSILPEEQVTITAYRSIILIVKSNKS